MTGGVAPATLTSEVFPSLDSPRLAVWQGIGCYAVRGASRWSLKPLFPMPQSRRSSSPSRPSRFAVRLKAQP